jgi:cytochrome P450
MLLEAGMDAFNRPIVPPAPKVHAKDLSSLRLLYEFTRNTLGVWPEHAFDDLITVNRALGITSALVNDPDAVRHVLTGAQHYTRPVPFLRVTRPLAGSGVLLAEGGSWKRQRRMLAPMFNPGSIGLFLPHFLTAAQAMARRLETSPLANLSAVFHETAFDAVLGALFSVSAAEAPYGIGEMARGYVTGPGRPKVLDGFAAREDDFSFDIADRRRFQKGWFAAVDSLIAARKAASASEHKDLLGLLLSARDPETGEALPDAEIRDQCATMLFAGFETTSRLLFWTSYLLTRDPIEQGRLRREVLAFPPDRVASLEDLQHWPRLRLALLEALRLYPSVPHLIRLATEDDEILGRPIPAGTNVWISPWVMHRHRKFWDQPTAFAPDRFAGQVSPWTSGAFVPFGGGPRICIGASFALAEAQIVMATLLSRFEFGLDEARAVLPVANVTIAPSFEPMFRLAPASLH